MRGRGFVAATVMMLSSPAAAQTPVEWTFGLVDAQWWETQAPAPPTPELRENLPDDPDPNIPKDPVAGVAHYTLWLSPTGVSDWHSDAIIPAGSTFYVCEATTGFGCIAFAVLRNLTLMPCSAIDTNGDGMIGMPDVELLRPESFAAWSERFGRECAAPDRSHLGL